MNKFSLKYNCKTRWLSYWYQINETVSTNPVSLLVIGRGSGIVENAIAIIAPKIRITTFDIDPELLPDVIGDVRNLPFKKESFDCILCCQVLEHLPFCDLNGILEEFHRVVRNTAVISVPHARKYIKIEFDAPLLGTKRLIFKFPFSKKQFRSKRHFWEINRGVTYKEVLRLLRGQFVIEKTFLNEIHCNHRFFILKKQQLVLK